MIISTISFLTFVFLHNWRFIRASCSEDKREIRFLKRGALKSVQLGFWRFGKSDEAIRHCVYYKEQWVDAWRVYQGEVWREYCSCRRRLQEVRHVAFKAEEQEEMDYSVMGHEHDLNLRAWFEALL